MRREAAVPIDPDLEVQVRGQQQHVARRSPGRHPHVFHRLHGQHQRARALTGEPAGMLNTSLAVDIRDERGEPSTSPRTSGAAPSPAG